MLGFSYPSFNKLINKISEENINNIAKINKYFLHRQCYYKRKKQNKK